MDTVAIINLLCEKLGIAVDWTSDNVVPKVEELITELAMARYNINHIMWIIGAVIALAGILLIIAEILHDYAGAIAAAGALLFILGLCITIPCIIASIQWRDMPEIKAYKWIFENVKR